MHDTKTFKATAGLARRLLMFSQLNHMQFDDKLIELAMSDLVDPTLLEGFPFVLDSSQLSSLQYVRDWESRAMLLCSSQARGRTVALANAWLEGGTLLIMAQPKFYGAWASLIQEMWPDKKISVFGNPRYNEKVDAFPEGIEFSEKPDYEADVFITSYGGLVWHNFVNYKTVDQTIVEELDNDGAVNYKWEEAVKGIFHEIKKPVFIQNVNSLPNDHGKDVLASLQANVSKPMNYLRSVVTKYLWAGLPLFTTMGFANPRDIDDYLTARAYTGVDNFKMLGLFSVSTHLLDDTEGHKKAIVFKDNTIKNLNQRKRPDSGLNRFLEREQFLEAETGLKLPQLVQTALDGDRPSQTLVGRLMVSQWATMKAQHLKQIHGNMANRTSRCLFLVENQDLKRALSLQFGIQMEDMSKSDERSYLMARFLYPQATTEYFKLTPMRQQSLRPIGNLLVTIDDLISEPRLLEVSNFLFLGELPLDSEMHQGVKSATQASGTRLVTSVISSTFEEEIYKIIR